MGPHEPRNVVSDDSECNPRSTSKDKTKQDSRSGNVKRIHEVCSVQMANSYVL